MPNSLAKPIHVRSAGSAPADEISPAALEAMTELGVDTSEEFPKPLTDEVVKAGGRPKFYVGDSLG